MQLEELARSILFGTRWEDKLLFEDRFEDAPEGPALLDAPRFPGRPHFLSKVGKAEFPKSASFAEDSTRGKVLHFFANHELLAMELMALMLLKFPDAPKPFRAGIARTIREEQDHLRLYVERMRELGVEFGELPVSDYFWNAMKDMRSPMEFVLQMSLTLEQANLDFSKHYQQAVAQAGDEKTAAILERVYLEEIGHVKHGLVWFNRWRQEPEYRVREGQGPEDDWDAYLRLLPEPMTPRRAKGETYAADARRLAGFSERYIRELEVHSGSKGRPPVFWIFNPTCDAEIVRGKPGFTPSKAIQNLSRDLEHVPMFLARETDVVWVQEPPRAEWLKSMGELGFTIPEFRKMGSKLRESSIGGFEPWGWSPEPFERFKPWKDRLSAPAGANGAWCRSLLERPDFSQTGLGRFFSKAWSVDYFKTWLKARAEYEPVFGRTQDAGESFSDWDEARERVKRAFAENQPLIAKAPWGTSGNQNKRILKESEMDGALGGWIRNTIESQGRIVLEPWLDKQADLSMQMEISRQGVKLLGIRRFVNGSQLEYRGTCLDPKLKSLSEEAQRFLHSRQEPLKRWQEFARELGRALQSQSYEGPAGVDAMIWRDPRDGSLKLKPLVELNPRWTMGRVALEIENRVLPGAEANWVFLSVKDLPARGLPESPVEAARVLSERHPVEWNAEKKRISGGIVWTSDPERVREVMTALAVGEANREKLL